MYRYIVILAVLFSLYSCNNTASDNDIKENYEKMFPPKSPEKLPIKPGILLNVFPQKVGELGIDTTQIKYKPIDKVKYTVTIDIYATLRTFKTDKTNLTKIVYQYLDEKGKLITKTLCDGKDALKGKSSVSPEDNFDITLYSGDLAYFAVFISPYGSVDYSSEMSFSSDDGSDLSSLMTEYNGSFESFHITQQGVEYRIQGNAMLLP